MGTAAIGFGVVMGLGAIALAISWWNNREVTPPKIAVAADGFYVYDDGSRWGLTFVIDAPPDQDVTLVQPELRLVRVRDNAVTPYTFEIEGPVTIFRGERIVVASETGSPTDKQRELPKRPEVMTAQYLEQRLDNLEAFRKEFAPFDLLLTDSSTRIRLPLNLHKWIASENARLQEQLKTARGTDQKNND